MKIEELKEIMDLLNNSEYNELEIKNDDFKLALKSAKINKKTAPVQMVAAPAAPKKEFEDIKSFNVGKFFCVDKSGNSLVKIGEKVKKGQKLGFIESVGIKADIIATVDGTISEVFVSNDGIAEYGKVLLRIEK